MSCNSLDSTALPDFGGWGAVQFTGVSKNRSSINMLFILFLL